MVREKLESIKRVLNVSNSTVNEYNELLDFYKERALDGCSSDLEGLVTRIFDIGYRSNRIDIKSPQKNYALCSLASITSKLTRGSMYYDDITNDEINYLITYYFNYYYFSLRVKDKFDYRDMRQPVLAISALDKYVTSGTYNNYESVHKLTKLSEMLFNGKIDSLEFSGNYGEEVEKNINHIAYRPADGPTSIDVFGIPVNRNDIVLKTLIDEVEKEENRFSEKMARYRGKM